MRKDSFYQELVRKYGLIGLYTGYVGRSAMNSRALTANSKQIITQHTLWELWDKEIDLYRVS